ncbi:MAG: glycosyltransferase family 4 protein [Butyrivibrio sp.]|nr:glycosyltransferase family 4 protein [Butyrivibrio sp.]
MRTILVLANFSAGLYDFRNEMLERLLEEYDVFVSVPDEVKTAELENEGCRIINIPLDRRGMNVKEDLNLLFSYIKLLKNVKPDLVMTYTVKPNIYGGIACRIQGIPYIATITGLGSTFQKEGMLKRLVIHMYRVGLKKAKRVFFQNKENHEIFTNYKITNSQARLVNGSGVNLSKHRFEEYPKEKAVRLLFIGRIMKEKGIEEFLEAANALHDENIIFETVGFCEENYQEKLNDYENSGIIKQYGFQTMVHEYIKAASAVVLPTYHEGMSNVLMEASATGRPVIASNISGCKEIFEEGVTGFGCEPQSSSDLIRAIKEFLSLSVEERERMGKNARAKMEREFDRNKVVGVYIKEINKVLENYKGE